MSDCSPARKTTTKTQRAQQRKSALKKKKNPKKKKKKKKNLLRNTCSFPVYSLKCPRNNLNLLGMRTSSEWQCARGEFPSQFFPSRTGSLHLPLLLLLLLLPSILIDAPQRKKKKGPLLLAGQKKKKLGSTSLFIHFPLQIQQAFSQLSFSPDHSYGFGYSSESVLSPFVFEDKVHCLKGKGIKVQGKKNFKNPTWRDHWGEHGNMCVIFNIVTPGLETGKLLYWQWDCNFVEYLSENTTESKSISFLSHCRWSSSWMF